jgi:two-component system sensor histidine kinase UhpB
MAVNHGVRQDPGKTPPENGSDHANLKSLKSVVETTDASGEVNYHTFSGKFALFGSLFKRAKAVSSKPGINSISGSLTESKGTSPMQELRSPYLSVGQSSRAHARAKYHSRLKRSTKFDLASRFSLFQKIFIANLVIILGGAVVGSWLTAQIAEAGRFNFVTFTVIITVAVLVSGAVSFAILKNAFRPFGELQQVLAKIHTGNSRARLALQRLTNPDVRHFTSALNQMLTRLEENAHVIQEDQRLLQLMTAQVINAQENERKRIARELHDEASQSLTAMIMGLEAARQLAPGEDSALQNQLAGLKDMAIATLEELRKLALDLRPTMLDDLGLISAVRWLSRSAAERANLDVQVSLSGFDEQERLAPELETCLFRITQESLTNIVKHAQASAVKIKLERVKGSSTKPEQVKLTVQDNGRGFDREVARAKAYQGGHLGLFDIEERAALLGGKVEISSSECENGVSGTCITVIVPLSGHRAEAPQGINTSFPPYVKTSS